jgi:hypothetical protein
MDPAVAVPGGRKGRVDSDLRGLIPKGKVQFLKVKLMEYPFRPRPAPAPIPARTGAGQGEGATRETWGRVDHVRRGDTLNTGRVTRARSGSLGRIRPRDPEIIAGSSAAPPGTVHVGESDLDFGAAPPAIAGS